MIKNNQKRLNRLHVALDALVIAAAYIVSWFITLKSGLFGTVGVLPTWFYMGALVLIVPGYLALYLHSPGRIVCTLLLAAAAVGLCKLLSQVMILYGRRRFAVLMLLTFFLSLALDAAGLLPFSPIGILMPGIIAREFDRQGFRDSLLAMAVTTGLTALALLLVGGALAGL